MRQKEDSLDVTARVPGNQEWQIEGYDEEKDCREDKDNDDIDNKDDDVDEKQVMVKEQEEDNDGKVQGHVNGKVKGGEQKADKEEDEVNVTWEYEEKV